MTDSKFRSGFATVSYILLKVFANDKNQYFRESYCKSRTWLIYKAKHYKY